MQIQIKSLCHCAFVAKQVSIKLKVSGQSPAFADASARARGKSEHQREPCPGKPGGFPGNREEQTVPQKTDFLSKFWFEGRASPPSLMLRRVKVKRRGKSPPPRPVTDGGTENLTGCKFTQVVRLSSQYNRVERSMCRQQCRCQINDCHPDKLVGIQNSAYRKPFFFRGCPGTCMGSLFF
jgi:hypothetical protein